MTHEWYKNTLALAETEEFKRAAQKYTDDLTRIYPVGSYWISYHGSRKGYEVVVIGHNFEDGILVQTIATGARKWVGWYSLEATHD